MDFLKNNKKFIERSYPEFMNIISNIQTNLYEERKTRNNEPNLAFIVDDKEYVLHSKYNAHDEAKAWVSSIQSNIKSGSVLLFGMGLGYFLEALIQLTEVKEIYVCEPSVEIFNCFVNSRDIRNILSNSKIKMVCIGESEILLTQIAHQIAGKISTEDLPIVTPPIYQRFFKKSLTILTERIKSSVINQIANLHAYHMFQSLWLNNILTNLPHTVHYPSLESCKDIWIGKRAIIIGSGPSLQSDIGYLKQLNNKCLIVAAGSSIQALQHHGINPDIIVSMDGGESNKKVFDNINTSKAPLLFSSQIHHKILQNYQGKMMHITFNTDLISKYFGLGRNIPEFLSTSTVTGTAIQAAEYMGIKEIILMGQDLSYPGKQYYSQGVGHVSEEVKKEILDDADLLVPNVEGGQNPTTQKMMLTLHDLELLISLVAQKGVRIINTSKMGANIKNTEFIPLEDMIDELMQLPCEDFSFEKRISSPPLKEQKELFSEVSAKLNFILKQSDTMQRKLSSLNDILQDLGRSDLKQSNMKVKQKLVKVDELWNWITNKETFYVFYTSLRGHHINIYMRYVPEIVGTGDSFKKARLISNYLGNLTRNIIEFIPELQDVIRKAAEHVQVYSEQVGVENK